MLDHNVVSDGILKLRWTRKLLKCECKVWDVRCGSGSLDGSATKPEGQTRVRVSALQSSKRAPKRLRSHSKQT